MILFAIIIFVIILGLLVFVHELGHFIMAKRAGMNVEEFGFGFPPRIFGIKRGETIYSINLIPLGGFVRITGEDGSDNIDPKSFGNKSFFQRFAVLIAGVTMNLIFAWVLISLALGLGLPTVLNSANPLPASARVSYVEVTVIGVDIGSPADQAGLKIGDSIEGINGAVITTVEEMQTLTALVSGEETVFAFSRGDLSFERNIIPRINPPEGEGPIGISLSTVGRVSYPWYETLPRGLVSTFNLMLGILVAFGTIIVGLLSGQGAAGAELAGPVGIAVLTRDVAQLGFVYLVQFTAVLSVNLAIINALPFPALDGGRILFLLVEKIRGRKMKLQAEQIANTVGFGLLILLMVFVTIKDFGRFEIIDRLKNLF
jgi:regulator of sigma E protease